MTELHPGLALYRDQLQEAIAQQLANEHRARAGRRRALQIGVPAALAALGGALALSFTGGSSVQSANAAILHHVSAALTSPPGTILHERALVTAGLTTQPYELWLDSGPPYRYRVIKRGHEGGGTKEAAYDPAAELRSLVDSGRATVDGSTTIDGVPAYKLTVNDASDRFLNGTAYVSQSDYRPLVIETTGGGGQRIAFQTYEHLPPTEANLRLTQAATQATSATRK
jgi:hypothetical protein